MSKLASIAKRVLGTQTVTLDAIVEQYDGVVTINSLGYTDYKGDRIPVFGFVEGEGQTFWGGCMKLRELATDLEEEYADLREVNAALQVEGMKIRISPTGKTKAGKPFRPVNFLGLVKFDGVREPDESPDELPDDPDDAAEAAQVAQFEESEVVPF